MHACGHFETIGEDGVVGQGLADTRIVRLEQGAGRPFGVVDKRIAVALEQLDGVVAGDFVGIGRGKRSERIAA